MSCQERRKKMIFSGNANPQLAEEIALELGLPLGESQITHFSDGEIRVRIFETVRGADTFIIQPICAPANTNLMELLIVTDALKRASAKHITAVVPYYGYARQDRKTQPRDPITAKLVANLITAAGADRVLTMDLHAGQIQGFFDIPVDNLKALPILVRYIKNKNLDDIVVVSPDVGGVTRARDLAERLGSKLAIIDKRRPDANVSEVMHIIGKVKGKTAILVDDIIDTAGTIVQAASALMEEGAKDVIACCSHPVLSGPAIERLENSALSEIIVTNSIPLGDRKCDKIKVLSIAPLMAEAIRRVFEKRSISELFV